MIPNKFLSSTLFLVSSTQLIFSITNKKEQQPNVIIIMSDDLGYGDVGCYGATKVKTPNIDKLAVQGIRFTSGYATASTSSPSRYSLLTGEYAFRAKVGILPGNAPMTITQDKLTIAEIMQQTGYETACIGKWHLGLGNGNLNFNKKIIPSPNEVGFDYSFIIPATNDRVPCVYMQNGSVVNLDPNDPIQVSYNKPIGNWPTGREHPELLKLKHLSGHDQTIINGIGRIGYMTGGTSALWKDEDMAEVLTNEAINFINKNSNKPFFLYFASHNIHEPRFPGKNFKGSSECGVYGDVIQELDWSVGEILKTLENNNISDNTMIIFLSDNGPMVEEGYKDGGTANLNGHKAAGVLKGGKYSLYEGGTRTPFIVRWPNKLRPTVSDASISAIDIFASIAKLINYDLAQNQAIDSRNALRVLLGKSKKTKHDEIVVQNNGGKIAIRSGKWKFIQHKTKSSIVNELYNLEEDISETINLANKYPKVVTRLEKRMNEIKSQK